MLLCLSTFDLFLYDDLLRDSAFLVGGDEEINTIRFYFHIVVVCARAVVVGFELVDKRAFHVVHLDADFASEVFEVELHLTVVGVGDDIEINGFQACRRTVFIDTDK